MTRKDFQLIADVLNQHFGYWKAVNQNLTEEHLQLQAHGSEVALRDLITTFAFELEKTNARFDKERFVQACLKAN
tara:strand:+ start:343 stop:567 length:225 start_codon:yes stop_codon:yes gene_type:complete